MADVLELVKTLAPVLVALLAGHTSGYLHARYRLRRCGPCHPKKPKEKHR